MSDPMPIRFADIQKKFRRGDSEITVLDGIDFEVAAGEFVALMGPSGSGKSTLLNLAAGLDKPTSGKVTVGQFEPATMGDNALCKWRAHHIGYIFQRYHLLAVLTAAQNIEVPLLLFNISSAERKKRVKTVLELVGLSDRADHFPRQLSGGQEQRVAIARAMVTDPTVLLADEPTGDLDTKSAGEILDLLRLLNGQMKKTILMVTHDPKAAQKAQRALHLEKGLIYEEAVG